MIRDILTAHFDRYPLMEARDAVKLIHQHIFGPGHLIQDREKALALIREEMSAAPAGQPLYESIGGGLCRLNLGPCKGRGIPAEDICALFMQAADGTQGDKKAFREAIRELRDMADQGDTPFEAVTLDVLLAAYDEKKCPPLRHSEAYRRAYRPAYRVVIQKKLKDYLARRREGESLQKS